LIRPVPGACILYAGGNVLDELRVLVEVQGLDARLHQIEKDRERLPRLIKIASEDLNIAESDAAAAEAALNAANKSKVDVDTELQTENEHLRKLKLRSTEIKTNKEYFAHLKEIEDCQKKISGLEETTLVLMEDVEKAGAVVTEKTARLDEEKAKFAENKVRIEQKFVSGDNEHKELTEKRGVLMKQLSSENKAYYCEILKLFPDSAVAPARDGMCTGCRMTIPPQVFQNVRKGETIVHCNNCRRVLYFKEA